MRFVALALAALLSTGCAKCSNEPGEAAPSTSGKVPHIKLSDQPRLAGSGVRRRTPDLEAVATGKRLHETATRGCKEDKCRYGKCSPLCAQWLRERAGDSGPNIGNQGPFFDCLGYCMNPNPPVQR